VIVDGVTN